VWTRQQFAGLCDPPVVGMIHLAPLPGAPAWAGDLEAVERAALADADALVAGGAGGAMLENYHDVPFWPERVPPITVAAMAVVAAAVRRRHPGLSLGINVLRNDAQAALAVAAAVGASFVRVNVHVGACVTDQGLLQGRAHETLRARRDLGAPVGIVADLRVKHGAPLAPRSLAEEARDLRLRGLADAVVLTGPATGGEADPSELEEARQALPDCPLLVGSGLRPDNLPRFVRWADGWIVGTYLQRPSGGPRRPVDPGRVTAFVAAVRALRAEGSSAL